MRVVSELFFFPFCSNSDVLSPLLLFSPSSLLSFSGLTAAIDLYGIQRKNSAKNYVAGDLGFDPLGLYPASSSDRFSMQTKELKNGRLAMVAIVGFAIQEYVTGVGVVGETPFFFKPLGSYAEELMNAGYLTGGS